jgi:sterol desaturase/sphingolipid hydroxylase (fatty acid hydroxylase superfamily)
VCSIEVLYSTLYTLSLEKSDACRFDFPFNPTRLVPFYGGAEFHDYHHRVGGQSQSNFSSVFTFCDYLYGTDKVSTYDPNISSTSSIKAAKEKCKMVYTAHPSFWQ